MVEVRRSVPEDIAFMYVELDKFSHAYGTAKKLFPRNEQAALRVIGTIIENHVSFTSLNDGKLSGFISGWFSPHPFNSDILVLNEAYWWVTPAYRDTKAGSMLLDAFVQWGRTNADWTTMSLESNSPIPATALLKRGFRLKEFSFIMESE